MGRQPDPGVRYPYRQLVPGDCWVSDAASPSYNQLVSASPCVKPNEDMYAIGIGPYRYLATVGYNVDPVVPGLGSAIFLHRHQYDSAGRTAADERLRVALGARPAGRAALAGPEPAPAHPHGPGLLVDNAS